MKDEEIAKKLEMLVELGKQWEEVLKKHSSCCREHLMEGYLLACKANRVINNFHVEFICTQDLEGFEEKLDQIVSALKQDMEDRQAALADPKVEVTFMDLPMGRA